MSNKNFTTLGSTKECSGLLEQFALTHHLGSKSKALIHLIKFAVSVEGTRAFRSWRSVEVAKGNL
jgi:hypothetical protein